MGAVMIGPRLHRIVVLVGDKSSCDVRRISCRNAAHAAKQFTLTMGALSPRNHSLGTVRDYVRRMSDND